MIKIPSWLKRTGIWFLAILVGLVSLYALACAWYSWSTKREWLRTKTELEARGEKLSAVELSPPLIPDERNFFATPLFREVVTTSDGRTRFPLIDEIDIRSKSSTSDMEGIKPKNAQGFTNLEYLLRRAGLRSEKNKNQSPAEVIISACATKQALWDELYRAAEKPEARFSLPYENIFGDPLLFAHVQATLTLSQIIHLRARAFLEQGKSDDAARDILLAIRLSDASANEPLLISFLVRMSSLAIPLGTISEGLQRQAWSPKQLRNFEESLASENLPKELAHALRGERGFFNQTVSKIIASHNWREEWKKYALSVQEDRKNEGKWDFPIFDIFPVESWLRGEMAYNNRKFQEIIDQLETKDGVIKNSNFSFPEPKDPANLNLRERRHLLYFIAVSSIKSAIVKSAEMQARIDMTRIACALARYRMAEGVYPEEIKALIPKYIERLPNDIGATQPYHYRRNSPDQFTLWSIGFDDVDNDAVPVATRNGTEGDWVWGVYGYLKQK